MSNLTQLYKSKGEKKKSVPWKQSFCLSNLLQPLLQYPSKPYCTFWAWAIWSTNVSSLSLQRSCLVCCMLYAFHISKCPLSMKRIDTGGWLKNHYKHTSKVPACHPSHLGIKTPTVIRNVRGFQVDHALHQPKNVLLGSFGMIPRLPQPMTSWWDR